MGFADRGGADCWSSDRRFVKRLRSLVSAGDGRSCVGLGRSCDGLGLLKRFGFSSRSGSGFGASGLAKGAQNGEEFLAFLGLAAGLGVLVIDL